MEDTHWFQWMQEGSAFEVVGDSEAPHCRRFDVGGAKKSQRYSTTTADNLEGHSVRGPSARQIRVAPHFRLFAWPNGSQAPSCFDDSTHCWMNSIPSTPS